MTMVTLADSDISIQNVKHSCSLDLKVLGNDLFLPKVECESGMKMTYITEHLLKTREQNICKRRKQNKQVNPC